MNRYLERKASKKEYGKKIHGSREKSAGSRKHKSQNNYRLQNRNVPMLYSKTRNVNKMGWSEATALKKVMTSGKTCAETVDSH